MAKCDQKCDPEVETLEPPRAFAYECLPRSPASAKTDIPMILSSPREAAARPTTNDGIGTMMQISLKRALAAILFLALGTGAAFARHPCHDDAEKFCSRVIPDHKLVQHCLEKNLYHLKPACQAEFGKRG
jgi:hypothetical protein